MDLFLISRYPLLWQFCSDMMNTCVLLCACIPVDSCHFVESTHCVTYRLSRGVLYVTNGMLGLPFCQMFCRCYSIVLLLYTSISYVADAAIYLYLHCFHVVFAVYLMWQVPRYTCIFIVFMLYLQYIICGRCCDILAFLYFVVLFIYLLMF